MATNILCICWSRNSSKGHGRVKGRSLDEEIHVQQLKEWKRANDECKDLLDEVRRTQHEVLQETEATTLLIAKRTQKLFGKRNGDEDILLQLGKHNFKGDMRSFVKSFQQSTREWLFKRLDNWFGDKQSRVMMLTAGPGVGNCVLASKVCQLYEEIGRLAACHFCKFSDWNLRNLVIML